MLLIPSGCGREQASDDFSHLGFALPSHQAIDGIASRAGRAGIIVWDTRDEVPSVADYCGVRDRNGDFVAFSCGQDLGTAVLESGPTP
jgi:hypothetical protein